MNASTARHRATPGWGATAGNVRTEPDSLAAHLPAGFAPARGRRTRRGDAREPRETVPPVGGCRRSPTCSATHAIGPNAAPRPLLQEGVAVVMERVPRLAMVVGALVVPPGG